jgi:hypothetical protein
MAPISQRRKKKYPIILTTPTPVPLAAALAPIPLAVAPTPIPLPAVSVPIPVVPGMAPPPAHIPLVPEVAGRAPPQARVPTQAEATKPIYPLGILVLGWQYQDLCLSATPPKRQTFVSVANMLTMSAQQVGDILLSRHFFLLSALCRGRLLLTPSNTSRYSR